MIGFANYDRSINIADLNALKWHDAAQAICIAWYR
jgi:hypothetical protein